MNRKLLNKLKCIHCGNPDLKFSGKIIENDLISGKLTCYHCNVSFPVIDGIPSFIKNDELARTPEIRVFNEHSRRYDSWFTSQKGRILFQKEVEALRHLIKDVPVGEWMEIGLGTGEFSSALGIPQGIDPAWNALLLAKKKGLDVVHGIAEELPYRNGSFNATFIIVTICYVKDPMKCLMEASRVLKSNGHVIIGFVNKESVIGQEYLEKKRQGHLFYGPATFYSFQEIQELLEKVGFNVEKVVSTLFQAHARDSFKESPQNGFWSKAGFVAVSGKKGENIE
ncbi:MAG: methyltransferase domain-containing protein [Candidatus Helarchaeales archaeon]